MIKLYYTPVGDVEIELPGTNPNTAVSLLADLQARILAETGDALANYFEFEFAVSLERNLTEGELVYVFHPFKNIRYSGNDVEIDGVQPNELIDFNTTRLGYSIDNPVEIEIQPSYDGTINMIVNDNANPPRLVNSRFSVTEGRRFYIVDREGNKDTNIYDDDKLDNQTKLYKTINRVPKLEFGGLDTDGKMPVGNYVFYFKFVDADDNESDIITESGIVSCHVGNINDPKSIRGGMGNENSGKSIIFNLSNIDSNYNFLNVYYSRSTSGYEEKEATTYFKLFDKISISSSSLQMKVTGFESALKISSDEINMQYNIIDRGKTQAQVQNRLFIANIHKTTLPYRELKDLSLRVLPFPEQNSDKFNLGNLTQDYASLDNKFEYYDAKNVYNYTGYWDDEIYRLAIVYIMNDYSLSDPYNIRGRDFTANPTSFDINNPYQHYKYKELYDSNGNRVYLEEENNIIVGSLPSNLENTKGVIRIGGLNIKHPVQNIGTIPISIKFCIPDEIQTELKKYTKGFFLVRQKRVPTIISQGLSIGHDTISGLPLIPERFKRYDGVEVNVHTIQGIHKFSPYYKPANFSVGSYNTINSFLQDSNKYRLPLKGESYFTFINENIYSTSVGLSKGGALLIPDIILNSETLSEWFSGSEFNLTGAKLKLANNSFVRDIVVNPFVQNKSMDELDSLSTHFVVKEYVEDTPTTLTAKLVHVPEDVAIMNLDSVYYSSRAGIAEEAWRFSSFLREEENIVSTNGDYSADNNFLIRGIFAPFVGAVGNIAESGKLLNVRILGYSNDKMAGYFQTRYSDNNPFTSITDRYEWERFNREMSSNLLLESVPKYKYISGFRGDCFVNQVSIRMVRNFQDPESPINDKIVDVNTLTNFKGYKSNSGTYELIKDNLDKINRGDVNAVRLGYWTTFKFCSDINYAFRCIDPTYSSEYALAGRPRAFHPLYSRSTSGSAKIAESSAMNVGYNSTTSDKYYLIQPDVPSIKNDFTNRVMFSEIHVNDSFKNGYRIFEGLNSRDYTSEFGTITKILSWAGNILAVFESGVALLPINERAYAGESEGGPIYVDSGKVLPEKPKVLSHGIGSTWIDSVHLSKNFVYGVDTVSKKIWRTDGNKFEIISDFKIQKFLNDNISFTVYDRTPLIGIRNVVTHFNVFKNDMLFTFYDQTFNEEERVWNLVWNESLNNWTTRYTWEPAFSENISNTFFTFNRETCKVTSMIAKSISSATGIGSIYIDSGKEVNLEVGDYLSLFYEGNLESTLIDATSTIYGSEFTSRVVINTDPVIFEDTPNSGNHLMFVPGNVNSGFNQTWVFAPSPGGNVLIGYDLYNSKINLADIAQLDFYRSSDTLTSISGDDEFIITKRNGDVLNNVLTTSSKPNLKVRLYVEAIPDGTEEDINALARSGWSFTIGSIDSQLSLLNTSEYYLTLQGKENYKNPDFNYKILSQYSEIYDNEFFAVHKNVDFGTSYFSVTPQALINISDSEKYTMLLDFLSKTYFSLIIDLDVVLGADQGDLSGTDKFRDSLYLRPSIETLTYLKDNVFNSLVNCPPLRPYRGELYPEVLLTEQQRQEIFSLLDTTINTYNSQTTTDLWKHGQSGIFPHEGSFSPAKWYGKQEPFEYEFIVNGDELGMHKIFDNLKIISNKAQPNSFEFEVVGDAYFFTEDVDQTMEELIGGKIRTGYELVPPSQQTIYDKTKEYRILNVQVAKDINKVGQRLGNMRYKEDTWEVEIKPIKVKKISTTEGVPDKILEAKVRDKYCKIRVKYTGTQLAVITALQTLYTLSYS